MERPSLWRASAEPGVGCARAHGAPVQTVCRRVSYAGSMARKGTTNRLTAAIHATRARMSQRPYKCVCGAPDRSELLVARLATTASLIGVLMVALRKLHIKR